MEIKEDLQCDCKQDDKDACSNSSQCMNYNTFYECNPEICPAKQNCQNRQFLNKNDFELEIRKTNDRGYGLFSLEPIVKGTLLIEYIGEVINKQMLDERLEDFEDETNHYIFSLKDNLYIDARLKGNEARYINHSCQPNTRTDIWYVKGKKRIGIFVQHIEADEEITFDYKWNNQTVCLCHSSGCRGFI